MILIQNIASGVIEWVLRCLYFHFSFFFDYDITKVHDQSEHVSKLNEYYEKKIKSWLEHVGIVGRTIKRGDVNLAWGALNSAGNIWNQLHVDRVLERIKQRCVQIKVFNTFQQELI